MAAVGGDDGLHDGQAKAGALALSCATALGEAVERLEEGRDGGLGDDRPAVGDRDEGQAVHAPGGDADPAIRDVVPHRIADQVRHQPLGQHEIADRAAWLKL
jgi:hypothetical protein